MDTGAMSAGGLVSLLIGLGIGALIGALLIMLGAKIVMGSSARFGSAVIAAFASLVAGVVIGFVMGLVLGAVAPAQLGMAQAISLVLGLLVTPLIYSALVRTSDDRKPTYVQGLLIYLIQIGVVIALCLIAVFVFRIPIPGMPTL
jgi:hypothetical protein